MVDVRQSLDDQDSAPFGYLGVRICGAEVWTAGRGIESRYLGPLKGARAGVTEPGRSRIGMLISRMLLSDRVPKNATLFVAFPDGARYERQVVSWDLRADWSKVASQVDDFNAAANHEAPPAIT